MQRPKRKQSIIPTSLLHPGSWRGKRSKSSRSGSPTDSGTSTPAEDGSQSAAQSRNPSLDESPGPQIPVFPSITRDSLTAARGSVSNREGDETPWKGLERALAALHITTKICPPLHSAVDGLKSCLHIFEEVAKSRKDYEELATGLTAMVDLLAKHMSATVSKGIAEPVANIARKITKEVESINQCQSRGGSRLLVAFREEEDLVRRYRRIEQLFHQLQAEASMSTWSDNKKHLFNTQLENLGPVKLATYNSRISMDVGRRSCTENTRTKILSDSMEWADDPDGAKIYWMNGMAGTGKTTIGYSLCERLEAAGQLAGSFFCTRTSRECSEAKQIVPTIAYQLARRSAPFRDALCEILDGDPDAGTLNTTSQFNSLLVKPLMESREFMARNLVVVIDALDECSDPHTVKVMLEVLFRYAANLPVKFFVTSRPEPVIRNSMMAGITECNRSRSILYLHEIEKLLVQADIELYLKDELKYLLPAHCADIEELAEQAGNLFIYAATAVRYIRPTGMTANSKQRLKTILGVHSKSNKGMFDIDLLYSAILSAALLDSRLEPDERRNIEIVLWTSICVCEPVLVGTLAALSGFDETELAVSALQPLRSVLHVSEHNNYVTTLHASFPDFMFAQERSKEFVCNRTNHNQFLAWRCLEIMKAQLRFNICRLESSFVLDDEILDLKERIQKYISQELFYASRYWVDHLAQQSASTALIEMAREFLSQRLLFWMEVMNLNKCIIAGTVSSTKLHMWLRDKRAPSDLINLACDAQVFIGKYTVNPVSASTPHIYVSLLPLSSPTSPIYWYYYPRFTGLVQTKGTLMEQVDKALLDVWSFSYPTRSTCFSGDRQYIAIGDHSGRICITNPQNGKSLLDFQAHQRAISSLTLSSDGNLIASSSFDCTICIWNAHKASLVSGPFEGHSGQVNSVEFSLDGMRLVSGSEDSTIRTWTTYDHSNSQLLITGCNSPVKSVVFSPDGLRIASGSNDHNVRIWDALNGVLVFKLEGHTRCVSCVKYSPCGSTVYSGSNDRTIRMWDVRKGIPMGNPLEGHSERITSISISPEGERIVSGSLDCTIRVWHRNSGEMMAGPFEGHTFSVESVEFSPDGTQIISASEDKTVRVWNPQGRAVPHSTGNKLYHGVSGVTLTTISPDGEYIASEHTDGTIKVWNVRNGSEIAASSFLTLTRILLLTFSSDSMYIFIACEDGVLLVLNAKTAEQLASNLRFSSHESVMLQPLALSSDGRSAISCTQDDICALDLWDVQSNQQICVIQDHKCHDPFFKAVFSSNNPKLATGTISGTIDLWDGRSGQHLAGPFCPDTCLTIRDLDISPDGTRIILVARGENPRIYDTNNGSCVMLPGPICSKDAKFAWVKFSPNAIRIAYLDHTSDQSNQDPILCVIPSLDERQSGYKTRLMGNFCPNEASIGFISGEPCLVSTHNDAKEIILQTGVDIDNNPYTNTLDIDGWFRDKASRMVVWVPPEIRGFLPEPNVLKFTEEGSIGISFDGLLIGEEWSRCCVEE